MARTGRGNARFDLFALLLVLFVLAILLVSPRGNFPLNDDWVYAKSVKWLLEEHRFALHPYAAANTAGQVVVGAAFSAPVGFSFTALRVSTLFLALLGAWATARTALELGLTRGMAILIGAMFLWNPISLNLSYTFMTDVPFLSFTAFSLWFFVRAAKHGRASDALWASAFAGYAFFIRQFSVVVPLAYVLTLVVAGPRRPRRHWVAVVAPWVVVGLALLAWKLFGGEGYPWADASGDRYLVVRLIRFAFRAMRYPFLAGIYLGLFLLPFSLMKAWSLFSGRERWTRDQRWVFVAFSVGVIVAGTGLGYARMPLLTNMLRDLGVGPLTLQDAAFDHMSWSPVKLPAAAWWAVTLVSLISGGLLVAELWARVVRPWLPRQPETLRPPASTVFLTLAGVFLLAAPCNPWLPIIFDRYLLPGAIPLTLVYAGGIRAPRAGRIAGALCAVAFYAFGVVCLQDYLAWNRARWDAVDTLRHTYGVSDDRIDAGFEFNGMYTSDEFMRRNRTTNFNEFGEKRWWVIDNAYAVSFLPRPGYETVDTAPYFSWLGLRERELLILRREPTL